MALQRPNPGQNRIGSGQNRVPVGGGQRPAAPGLQRPQGQPQQPQQAQQVSLQRPAAQQVNPATNPATRPPSARVPVQAASGPSPTGGMKQGMANPNDPNLKPLERLFALMAQYDSSDLHLKSGCPVIMRIKGEMRPLAGNPLSSEEIHRLLSGIASEGQMKVYEETGDLDFAHMLPDQARSRFRLNVFRDKRANALVARRISTEIPSFKDMNLPEEPLVKILDAEDGLIVLAGVTGSGKSTTIAGMIDWVNTHHAKHIVTVEDPIEYEFKNKRSFISQREIGVDCMNFQAAIRTLVRQDPDVILIGEMRDQETFEFGLTAAETGHLVFGTLHAGTVSQSIGRILGLFPTSKHAMLRQGLQFNLRGIICQKLLPSPRFGRVPINEILIATPIVKKILGEGEDAKLHGIMKGSSTDGMMTFDQCIQQRCESGLITEEVAMNFATNAEQLRLSLQGIDLGGNKGGILG